MGIVRIEKTKNYTVMSNYHLRDKSLSLKAKGLMSLMLSLPDDWDYSIAGLVSIVSEGETAVRGAITELINNKYLTRERVYENGKIVDWNYTLYEMPTDVELPVENQQLENLVLENQVQINTDINQIKTKKGTGSGASSKNHSQVYKQRNTLSDDLESGKDIDEQKKSKKQSSKDKFRDECLDIIEKQFVMYPTHISDLLADYFDFISAVPNDKENLPKRVKTVSAWKKKLHKLVELVAEGYDIEKLIQQSLDNKAYVFYPLQSTQQSQHKSSKENLSDTIKVNTQEGVQRQIEYLRASGKELY